ncbi:Rqc2 family fibronectin-binding protein [Spirochaeta africana]|uniref:Putative RNA-binding protein, snRNP like protein n=1 Tax=Spirochaeta africana (strain ATCC 700263 / DSM 8902 / Z-7692) TaxID=889378 RepID=H9UIZ0_SPIAZ|nr:NFACT family protein [Spirochaeta africana]AFG37483.1 putative RNA-binding protein, snRNP like protein [Spirochaeta africana DSM 8902]
MSLNWQEIDCVLDELQLPGCFIQKIKQPDFRTLVLDLYRPGEAFPLLFSLQDRRIRLHRTRHVPPNTKGSQRFAQLLRSHIQGGRITAVEHHNKDRIVRLDITHTDTSYRLWFRLWGGKANILLTDPSNEIIDAFLRRPQHGEASGHQLVLPEPSGSPDPDRFPVRQTAYTERERDFNRAIDEEYFHSEQNERLQQLQRSHTRQLQTRAAKLRKQLQDLSRARDESGRIDQYQTWGTLLLTHMHTLQPGAETHIEVPDYSGHRISIPIDPALSLPENADRLFAKAKKARHSADRTRDLLQAVQEELAQVEQRIQAIAERPEQLLENEVRSGKSAVRSTPGMPGLQFRSGQCNIVVGRTAAENDTLLRRYVKGNDWWLHSRDTPGAYVFIKPPPGKSVPLEVLLDAGNLAVWYSKAKSAGKADLFYTQVKYLKRVKGGKQGLVIPTQEKNLTVQLDNNRLQRVMGNKQEQI